MSISCLRLYKCVLQRVQQLKSSCRVLDPAQASYDTPHDWQRDDQMRPLTDKGKARSPPRHPRAPCRGRDHSPCPPTRRRRPPRAAALPRLHQAQAEDARRWFLEHIKLENCKILCASGARRATETLEVMASTRTAVGANATVRLVGALHPAGIAPKCEEMFDRLNYGPLTKFWAEPGGEEAFKDYADIVITEFTRVVEGIPAGKPGVRPQWVQPALGRLSLVHAAAAGWRRHHPLSADRQHDCPVRPRGVPQRGGVACRLVLGARPAEPARPGGARARRVGGPLDHQGAAP